MVDGRAQAGAEAGNLLGPVVHDALGANDERSARDSSADRLHRLAEAHVVGQDARRAPRRAGTRASPRLAAGRRATSRSRRAAASHAGCRSNPAKSGASRCSCGGRGASSASHRAPIVGEHAGAHALLVGLARRQQVGHEVAVRESQSAGRGAQPPPSSGTRSRPSRHARTTAAASARCLDGRLVVALGLEHHVETRRPTRGLRAQRARFRASSASDRRRAGSCQARSLAAKRMASVPSRSTRRPGTRFSSSRRRRSSSRSSPDARDRHRSPRVTSASPSTRASGGSRRSYTSVGSTDRVWPGCERSISMRGRAPATSRGERRVVDDDVVELGLELAAAPASPASSLRSRRTCARAAAVRARSPVVAVSPRGRSTSPQRATPQATPPRCVASRWAPAGGSPARSSPPRVHAVTRLRRRGGRRCRRA